MQLAHLEVEIHVEKCLRRHPSHWEWQPAFMYVIDRISAAPVLVVGVDDRELVVCGWEDF